MISNTENIRGAYVRYKTEGLEDLDGLSQHFVGATFDMWLQGELARAWDEGIEFFEKAIYGEATSAREYNPFRENTAQ